MAGGLTTRSSGPQIPLRGTGELGQAASLHPSGVLRDRSETGAFCQKLRDNGEGVVFGDSCPMGCCAIAETAAPQGCFANGGLSHGDAARKPPRLVANPAAGIAPHR
jgi:hypothetical protein